MTLRTAGLIAGAIGVVLLLVAAVANLVKPASDATPQASLDATVVVVTPEFLALSPDAKLIISGSGDLAAHTARVEDVDAWTASRTAVTITGISDWETLSTDTASPVPSASPSPSGTASQSAAASPSPSPSASPSASPSGSASASPVPSASPTPLGSQDIWRDTAQQGSTYEIAASGVPAGLALVVEALGDGTLTDASLTIQRTVDDAWIAQVFWWGVGLSIIGLIALIARFIDVRPAQSKGEQWLAGRAANGAGKGEPKPGSRRARRAAGSTMPVAAIPLEPQTGSIPIVVDEATPEDPVPMIAVSGPIPTVRADAPAQAYEPPPPHEAQQSDQGDPAPDEAGAHDEEERS